MPLVVPGLQSKDGNGGDDWMSKLMGKKLGDQHDEVVSYLTRPPSNLLASLHRVASLPSPSHLPVPYPLSASYPTSPLLSPRTYLYIETEATRKCGKGIAKGNSFANDASLCTRPSPKPIYPRNIVC